jgi:catechol 2,3-dioxygenase-like lactoylglutathione lyase family enzyme
MQPSRIHHAGLPVSDLDLSVAWYREALGLTHDSPPVWRGVLPSWSRRPASGSNCSQ